MPKPYKPYMNSSNHKCSLTRNGLWSSCAAIDWRKIKHLYDNGQEMHLIQIRVELHKNLVL